MHMFSLVDYVKTYTEWQRLVFRRYWQQHVDMSDKVAASITDRTEVAARENGSTAGTGSLLAAAIHQSMWPQLPSTPSSWPPSMRTGE
jgi:hypothetical protein